MRRIELRTNAINPVDELYLIDFAWEIREDSIGLNRSCHCQHAPADVSSIVQHYKIAIPKV